MFCERRILGLAGVVALIGVAMSATAGFAADFTLKKPLEMVIGNAPGGAMDRLARLTDLYLKSQKLIPNESIVLPKPGGGHAVALAYIKSHAKDPSRLMAVNTLLISNNLLGRSELKYSDFTPLAILYEEPMMFAVKYDSQITDGADLAKRLKADPTSVSFSVSSGLGTANHMAAILLAKAVGADIRAVKAVSFESGSEGITSVLGGHVDVVVTPPGSMMQFIETKQLRFIAVAGDHRADAPLADIPTWKEIGYDVSVSAWRGVIGPPGLKPEEIDFWQKGFEGFMKSDEYKKGAKEETFEARYLNAADSAKFLADMDAQFRDYLTLVGAAQSK
ncbi:tripartite tricarboxylate transporter substrate binding protein [Rhizobium sp. 1AS11]|uniref:tripartite tricarboxylate transporter substrate binding protein n=1 Tax=Rhizobium acaciae TaxID=2989736 RepID=UPI0022236F36|nr:tripartite tricarboxylate transporter substrate binding protein [Rhizobium acaciae]MCW1411270.1 tripartite tricarboxylate transporter substrate binding protein [Rhizobium acaciae]MCW1743318.1 tripartite tricarboxylate transporter substrate binding protein [Rhizobium acaciae]